MTANEQIGLSKFYDKTRNNPPSPWLMEALKSLPFDGSGKQALDLGCGTGSDTIELLKRNWRVCSIDNNEEAIQSLILNAPNKHLLDARVESFLDADFPNADLIVASRSLAFCPPDRFCAFWQKIISALKPGALFVGDFFGDRHGWSKTPKVTFFSKEEVKSLLSPLEILGFREVEFASADKGRPSINWHAFLVEAAKST